MGSDPKPFLEMFAADCIAPPIPRPKLHLNSGAIWIRARGKWYSVPYAKSSHKALDAVLTILDAEEWPPQEPPDER